MATRAATGVAPAPGGMSGGVQTPSMKKRKVDAVGMNMVQTQLVNAIKAFCRQGPEQKEQWTSYCDTNLGGTKDPSKSDSGLLQNFLDSVGIQTPMGLPVPTQGNGASFGGDPAKTAIVDQVKAFQRTGQEQKEAWVSFCNQQPGMRKDPNAYDAHILQS